MRFGEEGLFPIGQRDDQRVGPVVDRHAELAEARGAHPVGADDEEGLLTEGANQTNRLTRAEDVVQPLQRVLRAVGNVGAADETLKQADACGEEILVLPNCALDRHAHARNAGVRRAVAAFGRGPTSALAGEQGGGRGQQSGAEP